MNRFSMKMIFWMLVASSVYADFGPQPIVMKKYIVTTKPSEMQTSSEWLMESGLLGEDGEITGQFSIGNNFAGYFVETNNENFMYDAEAYTAIETVEEDVDVYPDQTPTLWGLDRINQRSLPYDGIRTFNGLDGENVDVYVIDTGIYTSHPNFEGRARFGVNLSGDFYNNDCDGHGTHVSGTIGSLNFGIAQKANLIAVKVFPGCPATTVSTSTIIRGVQWVVNNARGSRNPAVINMSLGGPRTNAMNSAVDAAVAAGIHVSVAAGNSATDACGFSPASSDKVVTVGSTTFRDQLSYFSNFGSCVDILAPGSAIQSLWYNGGLRTLSGTSMAAPHVSGVLALLLGEDPQMTPTESQQWLVENSTKNKIFNLPRGTPNNLLYILDFNGGGGGGECDCCERCGGMPAPIPVPTSSDESVCNGPDSLGYEYCDHNNVHRWYLCSWDQTNDGLQVKALNMTVPDGTVCIKNGNHVYFDHRMEEERPN